MESVHSCVSSAGTSVGTKCIYYADNRRHRGSPLHWLHWLKASEQISYKVNVLAYNVNMVWHQHTCVTNYIDQQTLKPDDDYVLPHQRLWMFDVLVCPLLVTERLLLQPLVCGIVVHHVTAAPSLSIFCPHLKSHLFLLSYTAFWRFCHLYSAHAMNHHFGHYNCYYIFNTLSFTVHHLYVYTVQTATCY